ncbi:MAG: type III secretion system export apparatus subunit SctR [Pseudomonadota bacterium]
MPPLPNPLAILGLVAIIGLVPFFALMTTSFVKISIVLSLIRNALGVQQVPPTMVLHGIALILTGYIMAPVISAIVDGLAAIDLEAASAEDLVAAVNDSADPLRDFLRRHTSESALQFFVQTGQRLWPVEMQGAVNPDNLLILVPAFTLSELKSAFEIGFLIFLPFIAIDLIISNILLAMGMMMVSPTTISLPFKLLLFVLLDGWTQLIQGLVLTYA